MNIKYVVWSCLRWKDLFLKPLAGGSGIPLHPPYWLEGLAGPLDFVKKDTWNRAWGSHTARNPAEFQWANLALLPWHGLHFLALDNGSCLFLPFKAFLLSTVAKDHAMWPTQDFTCGSWNIGHKYQRSTVIRLGFEIADLYLQFLYTLKLHGLQLVVKQLREYLDACLIDRPFDFCNSEKW